MSMFSLFDVAGMAMSAQTVRLNAVASNLANADSTGANTESTYRSIHPVFASVHAFEEDSILERGTLGVGVKVVNMSKNNSPLQKKYEPHNPHADKEGYVYASNVNLAREMADMISASKTYETVVEALNTAKELMVRTLEVGK